MSVSSREEALKGAYNGMHKIHHGIFAGIKVAGLAKIVKYDKSKHVADVLPMINNAEGDESAQYLEVPVAENCYIIDEIVDRMKPELAKADSNSHLPEHKTTTFVDKLRKKPFLRPGVPVIYVVLDRDTDNWKGGRDSSTFTPATGRMHDANDMIIVGVLGGDATNG